MKVVHKSKKIIRRGSHNPHQARPWALWETVGIDGTVPNFNEWNFPSVPSLSTDYQRGEQDDNKRKSPGVGFERSRFALEGWQGLYRSRLLPQRTDGPGSRP